MSSILLAGRHTPGDLTDRALSVAVDQQVRLGIEQHRTPHFFRPVVEVGNAAQRGFDAANHDRHVAIGFAYALRVNDH